MILAAKDDEVVILVSVETQVVVRVGGVPEERVWNGAARYPSSDDITRVQKYFRLEERRAQNIGFAGQRRMRRNDDVVACPLWQEAQLTVGLPAKNSLFRSATICIILRAVFFVSLSSLALSPMTWQ